MTTKEQLENIRNLLQYQKSYYSLEIYNPNMYDKIRIIKTNVDEEDYDVNYESEIDFNIDMSESDMYEQITSYIKTEWLSYKKGSFEDVCPFYKYTTWTTMDRDLVVLSEKFRGWVFVVYEKSELFIDNLSMKVFRSGRMIHSSNDLDYDIKLKMPNGTLKSVDQQGYIKLNPEYDVSKYLKPEDRGMGDYLNIATTMLVTFGETVCQLGSMVGEVAVVAQVIGVGLKIINEMQQDMIQYGYNKGRCKHLMERCKNAVDTLQQIPPNTLKLQHVVSVVDRIEASKNLINEYAKRWRVTRFIMSKSYKEKFESANGELGDCFNDFGINYSIMKKVFSYKSNEVEQIEVS